MPITLTPIEKALQDFVCAASGLADTHVMFKDGKPRPDGTYITLNIDVESAPADDEDAREHNPLVLASRNVEARTGNALTITAHPYVNADGPVRFTTTGGLPAGLALATDYWIIVDGVNTVRVASSRHNAIIATPVALSSDGTGTHTIASTAATRRKGAEILLVKQGPRLCEMQVQCYSTDPTGPGSARATLTKLVNRSELLGSLAILDAAGIGTVGFDTVQQIPETTNRSMYQGRAVTVLTYFIVARETETSTTIEAVEITNMRGRTRITRRP